jgi:hypothetical protein
MGSYRRHPGEVESIIVRREFHGAFQPTKEDDVTWQPKINTCKEGSAGISIYNPTSRAELIISFPNNLTIEPHKHKIWQTHKFLSSYDYVTTELQISSPPVDVRPNSIYWLIDKKLLQSAEADDVTFHVSWEWSKPIC